jgi:hypothetical protein
MKRFDDTIENDRVPLFQFKNRQYLISCFSGFSRLPHFPLRCQIWELLLLSVHQQCLGPYLRFLDPGTACLALLRYFSCTYLYFDSNIYSKACALTRSICTARDMFPLLLRLPGNMPLVQFVVASLPKSWMEWEAVD